MSPKWRLSHCLLSIEDGNLEGEVETTRESHFISMLDVLAETCAAWN